MEEENFDRLSVEERCSHKKWKARVSGYRELVSIFDDVSDERSDDWNKYVPIVKSILLDNNEPALEKGLEAVLIFVLRANTAAKIVGHVVAGLVKKCVASTRIRMKDLALQICLAGVEIEKQNSVIDELLKGTDSKNPKISVGCVNFLSEIIKAFGANILPVEGILRKLPVWFEDKDQNVRNGAKALTIELHRWLGNDIRANLLKPEILKPQKLAEISSEMSKIKDNAAVPLRFFRSQQKVQPADVFDDGEDVIREINDDGTDEPQAVEALKDVKPVDILSRIPDEFHTQVKAPKWSERKEALENLVKILSEVGKIQNGDYHEIVNILANIISKDANITVVCLAVKCITLIAQKLVSGFSTYSSFVFKALLEKLKDKKASVVQTLRDALDAVCDTSTFDLFVEDLSEVLKNKNPNVKSEGALFLSRCFSRLSPATMGKKSLKPLFGGLVTCLSDQDPSVRDQSAMALGVAMGTMGEKGLSPFLKDLEKTKLSKIKECTVSFLQASNKSEPANSSRANHLKCTIPNAALETTSELPRKNIKIDAPKVRKIENLQECKSETTLKACIADVISESTIKALSDKNWSVRMEAISQLQLVANSMSDVSEDLGELGPILSARILDSNPKISTASINLLTSLVGKIGSPFRDNLRLFLQALLKAVGDVKGPVRDAAVDGLTKIGEICGFGDIFGSEFLPESLKSGSNATKAKLWRWVGKNLGKTTDNEVSKSDLENILPTLFLCLEDKSAEVRAEASNAVEGFLKILPLRAVKDFHEKFGDKSNSSAIKIIIDKSKSLQSSETTAGFPNNANQKSSKTPSTVSKKKVSFTDVPEKPSLLDVNNMKNQRVIDEHKHKTAKWEFSTPRAEFVELLKALTLAANFSRELTSMMFHSDFKCHIKAMDMLTEEISKNSVGIVCNLDLILRWLTLRFFDGNPTVLSSSLDFIITTFAHLKDANYCLLDSEAAAFVPYLVMKLGDSKENIQTKVKEILVRLTSLYPVSKLKKFVMDGLKSNIARQRANCLDVIISYISLYGDSVYLKEIETVSEAFGKLLKDRDPGVKKRAFTAAGMLYNKEGEKILKLIEKQAGDDFRLVEEKVRRYVAAKPTDLDECITEDPGTIPPVETASGGLEVSPVVPPLQIAELRGNGEPTHEVANEIQTAVFQWDAKLVSEIEDMANLRVQPSELRDIDLGFMQEDSKSQPRVFQIPGRPEPKSSPNSSILSNLESIADDDLIASKNGMKYVEMMLNSGRGEIDDYVDLLIQKITLSLEKLDGQHYNEVLENYGTAFSILLALCNEKRFIEEFSEERLYNTLEQLLLVISNRKFSGGETEQVYRKTVNAIILKILQNGRKTKLFRCLLKMLGETSESGPTISGNLNELCMKCLWKLNRAQAAWDGELDYGVIFPVIREILRGLPVPWWKSRSGDMSLKTVKTVLRTMVKLRGERVLDDIGEDDESGLRRYLTKLVKYTGSESTGNPSNQDRVTTVQNLSPNQAKELSDIFGDIALNSPEALQKLNEFRRRNPLVDLQKILSTMSPTFHRYFLAITGENEGADGDGAAESNPMDDVQFSKEVGRMWGKLKCLQQRIEALKET